MDAMYEDYSRPPSAPDCFDTNKHKMSDPNLLQTDPEPDIPPEYEVYDTQRRPSALLHPSTMPKIDIESLLPTENIPDPAL